MTLPFGKRKKDGSPPQELSTGSNSLAFQEDSSVSSWSKGSSPENTFVPYGSNPGPKPVPPELNRLHGLGSGGFGLAAADAADEEEERRKERERLKTSDDGSRNSEDSLQDKLDQAIESGDWAAVERLANKMLDTVSSDGSEKYHDTNISVSSYDNSMQDGNSRSGWESSGGQSTTTVEESIDDERISMLEKLIETDDWQGIVTNARIYNIDDSTNASESIQESRGTTTGDSSTGTEIPSKASSKEEVVAQGQVWKALAEEATEEKGNDVKSDD